MTMNGDKEWVETTEGVVGYMCRTDFDHELGYAEDGTTIYPSIESLHENRECAKHCGIVEVEVRLRKVVSHGTGE